MQFVKNITESENSDIKRMFGKTKILLAALAATTVLTLTVGVLNIPNNFDPRASSYESVEYPTKVEGILDGCGGIFVYDPPAVWYGSIPENYDNGIPVAPMFIPAYGYMSDTPFDQSLLGSYNKDFAGFEVEKVLRAMWDGVTVIWYSKDLDQDSYDSVASYVNGQIQLGEKIMLLPFTIKGKAIPLNRSFAFARWNGTQSCEVFNLSIFDDFKTRTNEVINPRDTEPPVAPLDEDGNLRSIQPYRGD